MATTGGGQPDSIPQPRSWKGHDQPCPDKRLNSAKIFLADEDPDRCLEFASRIAEIEEYVAYIEKGIALGTIECNSDLLRDVKVKITVHREWQQRREDGIPDLGCDQKPYQLPYSTRTSGNQAPARPNPIQADTGVSLQVRDDHPPFSIRREDDHAEFLAAMRKDASGDPDEIDVETNLLWTESRAYGWALRDPVLIPTWMHPTKGIPKKGVSMADSTPWYRKEKAADPSASRPTRGWIPGYLLARESKINNLMKMSNLNTEQMEELEELLHFIEPPALHHLHATTIDFDKDDAFGILVEEEQVERQRVAREFAAEQRKWMSSFTDVYFILKTSRPRSAKSVQSGVFYIDHGVMDLGRQKTLEKANDLLTRICGEPGSIGFETLDEDDIAAIEVFSQLSQPDEITKYGRRRALILRQAGLNSRQELDIASKNKYDELYRLEQQQRVDWLRSLAVNDPEFRYLRPGELPEVPVSTLPTTLYIPWEIASVPTVQSPILPEVSLPVLVQKLQAILNSGLSATKADDPVDSGIDKYIQVAYPDLRTIGLFWLKYQPVLKIDPLLENSSLSPGVRRLGKMLDLIFTQKFKNWRYGLLSDRGIAIKIPRPCQEDERPGILYSRNSVGNVNEDDTVLIQNLLDKARNRGREENRVLREVLTKYQYAALRHVYAEHQDVIKTGKPAAGLRGQLEKKWNSMMDQWIITLEGSAIEIKKPNAGTMFDNDPTTAYYRGPLVPTSYPTMSTEQLSMLKAHLDSNQHAEDFQLFGDVPKDIELSYQRYQKTKRPEHGLLYAVQLLTWQETSLNPSLETGATPSDASSSGATSVDPTFVEEHEDCAPDDASGDADNINPLGVDFTPLHPEILLLEKEINRIVHVLKIPAAKNKRSLHKRLRSLLKQFLPCDIQHEGVLINRLQTQLHERGRPSRPELEDLRRLKAQWEGQYLGWEREIRSHGVTILLNPQDTPIGSRVALEFRAHTTNTGHDFEILGLDAGGKKLATHRLSSIVEVTKQYTEAEKRIIHDWEFGFNDLLGKLSQGEQLDWEASESLLSKLRAIFPDNLKEQEKEHLSIDAKARLPNPQQSRKQDEEFWASWGKWDTALANFMRTIPNGKVEIDISNGRRDPANRTTISLAVPVAALHNLEIDRSRDLPHAVRRMAEEINEYLLQENDTDSVEREFMLLQLLRPVYGRVGQLLIKHIEDRYLPAVFDPENLTPEVKSMIDSIARCSMHTYRDLLRSSGEKVAIEEVAPGRFRLSHASILDAGDSDLMSDATEDERVAGKLLGILCLDIFTPARRDFLRITTKVRRSIVLTADEQSTLFEALKSAVDIKNAGGAQAVSDVINKLATKFSQPKGLVGNELNELLRADNLSLWNQWVVRCSTNSETPTDLRHKVAKLLGTTQTPLPRSVGLTSIQPPTTLEIQGLQVELNNLLTMEKNGTITRAMSGALGYLLLELLPPAMKLLQVQSDMLNEGGLSSVTISMVHGMGVLEAQRGFESRYRNFKEELHSRFGVVLDSWWYSAEVIAAACARWRFWKNTIVMADGSTYPITPLHIEDERQQKDFEIYSLLTDWVNNGCPDNVSKETDLRLLLKALPGIDCCDLAALRTQIRDNNIALPASEDIDSLMQDGLDPAQDVDDLGQDGFHLALKEQFIKSYMAWYSAQTSSTLEDLSKRYYAGAESSLTDFTGKAERRGIQRAAIEIALNLFASNQEQHRPADRFRVLDLSRQYVPLEKEVSISLPLDPTRRQPERDTFEFTKKMLAYKEWKDFDYEVAREKLVQDPSDGHVHTGYHNFVDPPINYHGPFAAAQTSDALETAHRRQTQLSQVALKLQSAYTEHPRPLLKRLLSLISQGMDPTQSESHPLHDNVPLTKQELDLLEEIAGDSWDEIGTEYPSSIPALNGFGELDIAKLLEFEADLEDLDEIPLWSPRIDPDIQRTDDSFRQIEYSADVESESGITLHSLSLALAPQGNIRYCHDQMRHFLLIMASAGRIHFDEGFGEEKVSWIPYSGHPENKYVTSRDEALSLPYIRRNKSNQLEVQYDAAGAVGPPIIQPNKYEYFQRLAFRLGRNTLKALQDLQTPREQGPAGQLQLAEAAEDHMKYVTPEERGEAASSANVNLSDINVTNIAREVCNVAPHLAKELGIDVPVVYPYSNIPTPEVEMTPAQATDLIQLKILEEVSDNFERKFPVNETVWDFAKPNLETKTRTVNGRTVLLKKIQTKFFSVRRYPICCQTEATKEAIKKSGPEMPIDPAADNRLTPEEDDDLDHEGAEVDAAGVPLKTVRHIRGQRPYYPFGETPYQEAYQSHIMEYELRDVKEFQPTLSTLGSFNRSAKNLVTSALTGIFGSAETAPVEPEEDPPIPNDPHPLPRIPSGWKPDNISVEEMRLRLIEEAKNTPGFPDPSIQEYYHTQEEIQFMRDREEMERRHNVLEVQRYLGNVVSTTQTELATAQRALGIDPATGLKIDASTAAATARLATTTSRARPSRPTASGPVLKSAAQRRAEQVARSQRRITAAAAAATGTARQATPSQTATSGSSARATFNTSTDDPIFQQSPSRTQSNASLNLPGSQPLSRTSSGPGQAASDALAAEQMQRELEAVGQTAEGRLLRDATSQRDMVSARLADARADVANLAMSKFQRDRLAAGTGGRVQTPTADAANALAAAGGALGIIQGFGEGEIEAAKDRVNQLEEQEKHADDVVQRMVATRDNARAAARQAREDDDNLQDSAREEDSSDFDMADGEFEEVFP